MSSLGEFTAVQCVETGPPPAKTTLVDWDLESVSPTHQHFDASTGVYIVPRDGLYMISLFVIPLGGNALKVDSRRTSVRYAIRLVHPCAKEGDIESDFLDVGSSSFGQIEHLAKGTTISCERLPDCNEPLWKTYECLRFKVACIQRKRKVMEEPLSKNEIKKRRKLMRKQMKVEPVPGAEDSGQENDSEWDAAFESDSSSDDNGNDAQSSTELVVDAEPVEDSTEELNDAFSRQVRSIDALLDDDDETPPLSPMYSPTIHSPPFAFQPAMFHYSHAPQPYTPPLHQHQYNNNNNNNNQYRRRRQTQYRTQYQLQHQPQHQQQSSPTPSLGQSQPGARNPKRRTGRGGASNRNRPASARKKKRSK